ncbi:MAG: hypothetical protein RLN85_19900, partial [Pseudomonadales bacterium]
CLGKSFRRSCEIAWDVGGTFFNDCRYLVPDAAYRPEGAIGLGCLYLCNLDSRSILCDFNFGLSGASFFESAA